MQNAYVRCTMQVFFLQPAAVYFQGHRSEFVSRKAIQFTLWVPLFFEQSTFGFE